MALRFLDGFDHVSSNTDLARKWTSVVNTPTLGSSTPATRNGVGQWLRFPGAAESCSKTIDSQASWVVGFALYVPTIASGIILRLLDSGTTQVDLRLSASGTFSVTRNGSALTNGTSTYALSAATWVYVELKVTIANSIGAGRTHHEVVISQGFASREPRLTTVCRNVSPDFTRDLVVRLPCPSGPTPAR